MRRPPSAEPVTSAEYETAVMRGKGSIQTVSGIVRGGFDYDGWFYTVDGDGWYRVPAP